MTDGTIASSDFTLLDRLVIELKDELPTMTFACVGLQVILGFRFAHDLGLGLACV